MTDITDTSSAPTANNANTQIKGLKKIGETLKEAVGDLTSLEVVTYTGNMGAALDPQTGKVKWDELIPKAADDGSDIKIALATKINIDGDATHFVQTGDIDDYILTTHAEAVKNGSEFRAQVIDFLGGKIAGILS